jgi:CubicO group peptidase (beta-lactamase class C family)
LKENLFPGVVVCLGSKDKIIYHNATGNSGFADNYYKLGRNDIFNIGLLTGFGATTQAIMMLVDSGKIKLNDPAYYYLPQFYDDEKRNITIEHLVSHTSGFAGSINQLNPAWNEEELVNSILEEELALTPGAEQNYSTLNLVALQKIITTVTGKKIDEFINADFYSSIGMKNTMFRRHSDSLNILSSDEKNLLYTSVKTSSDVMLEIMDGVSGFDGLHSTAYDLAIFSRMILQKGYYDDTQYLKAKTVIDWLALEENIIQEGIRTKLYTSINGNRDYTPEKGFMFIDPYGSAIMIDMEKQIFLIVLSNPGIRNPANKSFVKLVNNLIDILQTDMQ